MTLLPQAQPKPAEWVKRWERCVAEGQDKDGAFAAEFGSGLDMVREVLGPEIAEAIKIRHRDADEIDRNWINVATALTWGHFFQRPGLNLRDRALVILGCDVAQKSWPAFKDHVKLALHAGLSGAELREAIAQLTLYCGIPTVREAFDVLGSVLAEAEGD